MFKKKFLPTFIIGPLVSLSLFTAFAGAAHAQDYDDDAPRVLTRAEVVGAYTKFQRIQNTIRAYAATGVDAERLLNAANTFDLEPGQRPDEVELIKISDSTKASDPNAHYEILRILNRDNFQSFEDWNVTVKTGADGKVYRIAKLNIQESRFGEVSYASLLQTNVPNLLAAYNAGKLQPITEDDVLVSMSTFYINDLAKPVVKGASFVHVIAKGITADGRGAPMLRAASIDYYNQKDCNSPDVAGSNFGPNSDFARRAHPYTYQCKVGLIANDGQGGVSRWYPGDQKPTAPSEPTRP